MLTYDDQFAWVGKSFVGDDEERKRSAWVVC